MIARHWTIATLIGCLLAVLPAANVVHAAEPSAQIVAADHAEPGNLVVLKTDGTVGTGHQWLVLPASAQPHFLAILDSEGNQAGVFAIATPGTYTFVLAVAEGGQVDLARHVLTVGDPPDPDPEPGPDPPDPPDPPESGKRHVLIVRETAESTPAIARAITLLRQPPNAEYLAEEGHALSILDDDSVGPDGEPTPVLESWRPHFAEMELPVVFVIDRQSGELIHKQELGAAATAEDVIQILKEHGG